MCGPSSQESGSPWIWRWVLKEKQRWHRGTSFYPAGFPFPSKIGLLESWVFSLASQAHLCLPHLSEVPETFPLWANGTVSDKPWESPVCPWVCVGGVCGGQCWPFLSGNHPPLEEWLSVLPHTRLEATIRDFPLDMET